MTAAPIGVFDSGVGGLSVLRAIRSRLPAADLIYVADSGYVPYGTRPPEFIRRRSLTIVRYLIEQEHVQLVVVACNTATTHAVDALRTAFPHVPIVGVEPAVKPAAHATRTGVVGVLATDATLGGNRFAALVERHANGVDVITQPSPELVAQVEAGDLSGPRTLALLRDYTALMRQRGADTIVLGCTHYAFLHDALRQVVGPDVEIIDTAPAIARQVERVLGAASVSATPSESAVPGRVRFLSSGDVTATRELIERLWPEPFAEVEPLPEAQS